MAVSIKWLQNGFLGLTWFGWKSRKHPWTKKNKSCLEFQVLNNMFLYSVCFSSCVLCFVCFVLRGFVFFYLCVFSGHYITNPKQCTINGKSLKFTIHLHCLMPPKYVIQWSLVLFPHFFEGFFNSFRGAEAGPWWNHQRLEPIDRWFQSGNPWRSHS